MGYMKWKPNKAQKEEFKQRMNEIESFISENRIDASASRDSFYFEIAGQKYRVSNHAVESSPYHPFGRLEDVIYIHASKTRLIEIYTALAAGKKLNGRGAEA